MMCFKSKNGGMNGRSAAVCLVVLAGLSHSCGGTTSSSAAFHSGCARGGTIRPRHHPFDLTASSAIVVHSTKGEDAEFGFVDDKAKFLSSTKPRRSVSKQQRARQQRKTSKTELHMSSTTAPTVDTTKKQNNETKKKKKKRLNAKTIRRRNSNKEGKVWLLRDEMLNHEILTREQELELGEKIVKARKMRDAMSVLIEEVRHSREILERTVMGGDDGRSDDGFTNEEMAFAEDNVPIEFLPSNNDAMEMITLASGNVDADDLSFMTVYGSGSSTTEGEPGNEGPLSFPDRSSVFTNTDTIWQRDRTQPSDISSFVTTNENDNILTEEEIQTILELPGGRTELRSIFQNGALARDKLIRSNIRLVVSIAKTWMKRSAKSKGDAYISNLYGGSWDLPSLDEAIQDGILGLARAADKFEPSRGLRFSTYATYWVKNYVRICFQRAKTGCLKVPGQLHEIKANYQKLLRRSTELNEPFPSEDKVATELGVSVQRLRTALRVTQSLSSIDAPVSFGAATFKGSGAGDFARNMLLVSDTLQCAEPKPEDTVELSFLRQCLENAMATQLSPHERDVLRLRLGLDDGFTRTAQEVVDVCGGGMSSRDVRTVERRAYRKLRSLSSMHTRNLLEYLDFVGVDYNSLDYR